MFSLEDWDEIWRRNQFLVQILLERNSALRVLFVEPPVDSIHDIRNRRRPARPRFEWISAEKRLRALRPLKPLPRRLGGVSDASLLLQARLGMRAMGFSRPTLWINDLTYGPLIRSTGYPSLYDVTDDWLLAPLSSREVTRLRRLEDETLREADEVVVCSPALRESRGARRSVTLIPNGVDVEHFRRPAPRPRDLPASPVAVYVGTLHTSRLDVSLVLDLARELPELRVVLVGPNSLEERTSEALRMAGVALLGPRPYSDVPGYLKHADVVVIPHVVSPFTESLDPIKAYEVVATGRPTIATPVAGFRGLGGQVTVVGREGFVEAARNALRSEMPASALPADDLSWKARADAFQEVLLDAQKLHNPIRPRPQHRVPEDR